MQRKLKNYASIIIMLAIAAAVATLIAIGILDVEKAIAAVKDNKLLALAVIIALFLLKGVAMVIPHLVLLLGTTLVFDLEAALAINIVGTFLFLIESYVIGRFSKNLTFESVLVRFPKFRRYFENATEYSFTFCYCIHTLHLPTEVQGVLFGLLRIPFSAYITSSMLALLPSIIYFTILGNNFDLTDMRAWICIAIDVTMIIVGLIYAKRNIIDGGKDKKADS